MSGKLIKFGKANPSDSFRIACLHKREISMGFLSQQPTAFLKILYSFLIKKEIVYVAKIDGKVIGFVSGTSNTGRLYKNFITQNFLNLIPFIIKVIFSPAFIKKSFESLLIPKKLSSNKSFNLPELLSIAVDKNFRGKGIGERLVKCLENEFAENGVLQYKVIVGAQLIANKFYRRLGFVKKGEVIIHNEEISNIYIKQIDR